jgi:AAA+ superfamily predicted ATPase
MMDPRLQFTRDARRLFGVDGDGITTIERRGARQHLAIPGAEAIAAFSDQLWTIRDAQLERWTLDGRLLDATSVLDGAGALTPTLVGPAAATWGKHLWVDDLGSLRQIAIEDDVLPFIGRRTVTLARQRGTAIARLGAATWTLPPAAHVVAVAALFDGAGVALVVERGDLREAWIGTPGGVVHHRIELPVGELRIAARRGLAVVCDGDRITSIDLRFGRVLGVGWLGGPTEALAIDPDGTLLAIHDRAGIAIVELAEVMRARPAVVVAPEQVTEVPSVVSAPVESESLPAPSARATIVRPLALPGLAPRTATAPVDRAGSLAALEVELRLVAAWTYGAIARDWDSRRLGYANESAHPHEHEVAAILGKNAGFATDLVVASCEEIVAEEMRALGDQERLAPSSALGALAAELGLSALAVEILLVVAAPAVWGDLARLYGILANDAARPLVDELLVEHVLAGRATRHDIARELDPRAPLVCSGAIEVGTRARPFAQLAVDPVVIARLRAEVPDLGPAVAVRADGPALEGIVMPPEILEGALVQLARPVERATRIVVRGRTGTGRRTVLAALASEVRRPLAIIDPTLLPRAAEPFAITLRVLLRRIHLAGLLPCVIGLDAIGFGERDVADVVGDVLRTHPGPLALSLGAGAQPPLDPGHVVIDLPTLDETARLALWRAALEGDGRWVRDVDGLAARYRVGPGVVHRAIAALAELPRDVDATETIEGYIRQTRDARLAQIAHRVDRLASWSSLVLPPDVLDSLRELVARVRHRRQVFEHWGLGDAMTTSRGLTALFSGQPGTGKTLVAGVIARELGLDLYQVDLSKVMSKWIGETERNLATVFDAAEDGQVILLFDEADSLFAKRTEVRSSNDRYANLEVNYLLQRLDSFEGIAILTTNFGTSIDPAFKRRLSFRLSFPFPDEETRTQLWRAHLPPKLPIAGELALDKLARKYQIAGGYIRNACLRAAFLAAQDEGPMSQDHLERAVALEFAELGKLSSSGAID